MSSNGRSGHDTPAAVPCGLSLRRITCLKINKWSTAPSRFHLYIPGGVAGLASLSLKKAHIAKIADGILMMMPASEMVASVDKAIGVMSEGDGLVVSRKEHD